MANRTDSTAQTVHGTNPQFLIEKILRNRIYNNPYWKEECFGLTAEGLAEKAMELKHFGGTYGGNRKPTHFMCLILKMLQIQPEREIVHEFIKNDEHRYVRVLGAFYLRLVGKPVEIYNLLEPLYADWHPIRKRVESGKTVTTHVDEFIDELLHSNYSCDVVLPFLPKRYVLEQKGLFARPGPRRSMLEDLEDLSAEEEDEEDEEEARDDEAEDKEKERKRQRREHDERSSSRRSRSPSRDDRRGDRDRYRDRERDYDRRSRDRDREYDRDRRDRDRHGERRSRDREYDRDRRDRDRDRRDRHRDRDRDYDRRSRDRDREYDRDRRDRDRDRRDRDRERESRRSRDRDREYDRDRRGRDREDDRSRRNRSRDRRRSRSHSRSPRKYQDDDRDRASRRRSTSRTGTDHEPDKIAETRNDARVEEAKAEDPEEGELPAE